jgi:O-antigen ligase
MKTVENRSSSHSLAFAGLFLFTLLLYMRPNEMFPELFGSFPIVRIVAAATLLLYLGGKLMKAEPVTVWPIELLMLFAIALLAVAHIPVAVAPSESIDMLIDPFLKVVTVVILMINLIDSRRRLSAMIKLVVISGAFLALAAIRSYLAGEFVVAGSRIRGLVGGIFGNPNDLATALDILLPLSVGLALTARGLARVAYFACAAVLTAGVVITFSRGGFLGLLAAGAVLLWKFGRRNRAATVLAGIVLAGVFIAAIPNSFTERMTSMFDPSADPTGSTQARRDLLSRAFDVAARRPIVGVGMGNFHIYSIQEQVAHNSYLEISAELGVLGLAAYLAAILFPLRSLRRVERESERELNARQPEASARSRPEHDYYLSLALQTSIIVYLVCSFFSSVQYLWYVYYPVAYAIALRRLHAAEAPVFQAVAEAAPNVRASADRGAVFSRRPGVLWSEE